MSQNQKSKKRKPVIVLEDDSSGQEGSASSPAPFVDLTGLSATQSSTASPATPASVVSNPYKRTVSSVSKTSTTTTASSTSNSSSRTNASVINPYRKTGLGTQKFIGGAEQARRMARKKSRGVRIMRPGDEERLEQVLPKNMNIFERFFAALLRSSPNEFLDAAQSSRQAQSLWEVACKRVGLQVPTHAIRPCYDDADVHFAVRAALVLEEARNALSTGLEQMWKRRNNNKSMYLRAHYIEMIPSNQHSKITFSKQSPFTKEELYEIRPGGVFACLPRDLSRNIQNVALGVVTSSKREEVEKKHIFQLVVFRELPSKSEDAEWIVSPIAPLITELRCFESMTCSPKSIAFLNDLLGRKGPVHIRFGSDGDSGESNAYSSSNGAGQSIKKFFATKPPTEQHDPMFKLHPLNATQEKAVSSFLNAPPSTVTLILGPPGSGKTTFLARTICQYLKESLAMSAMDAKRPRRRLLVCAPTNKAVSVLASRFLAAVNQDTCPCTIIMAGDEKLLVDERSGFGNSGSSANLPPVDKLPERRDLRSIYLYSWVQALSSEYRKVQSYFVPGRSCRGLSADDLHIMATRLENRLIDSLRDLPKNVVELAQGITACLKSFKSGGSTGDVAFKIDQLLEELKKMPFDNVWRELMKSADVIFCTLASAGGMIFKTTCRVDDLIVDEAAASTEPELCIPFHLKPSRLLAVGDPLQLPATVLSRRAIELGLSKSLHERLMYECDFEYTMLDVQYRMSPLIASFPSRRFYDSKISNGANVENYQRGSLLEGAPYTFLQVNGLEEQSSSGSFRNHAEAKAIVELVSNLRAMMASRDSAWYSADRVRIITFYQAQVALIKSLLFKENLAKKVVVATVDSSQGCEANLVLVSFVRSPSSNKMSLDKHDAGFLTDDRRMNVSLTRAKYQLICVGNIQAMKRMVGAETLQLLAEDAEKRDIVRPYPTTRSDVNASLDLFYGPPQKKSKVG